MSPVKTPELPAPFPWFGGKSRVASVVWERFGRVGNYVEPFFGSGAVLLGRPGGMTERRIETVNDKDGFVANFWRACSADPDEVWRWADSPVNEADLTARHLWCIDRLSDHFLERLMADPEFFDARLAGYWVWGLCSWIGSGWCSGKGPWQAVDGILTNSNPGRGVNRQMPHVGNPGHGVNRKMPDLGNPSARGIGRQSLHVGDHPLAAIGQRMRHVRVLCGDWRRVLQPSAALVNTHKSGIFLDPPYPGHEHQYTHDDSIAHDVREWCAANGDNPRMRIALCGYAGQHDQLEQLGWGTHRWKTKGGYAATEQAIANTHAETIWFSPHCVPPAAPSLFDAGATS